MASLQVLTLLAAISAGGETVLIDLSATWCGPCQQMKPIVHRLEQEGYPVRVVDVDRQRQYASQFRPTGYPCFIMVVNGREVERHVGMTSYNHLRQMLAMGEIQPAEEPQLVAVETQPRENITSSLSTRDSASTNHGAHSSQDSDSVQRRALAATVRIKVEDRSGNSFGTGTVIDNHGEEALVLTCGHIFRDSEGKGEITVDLFLAEGQRSVSGMLIAYDLTRDIGLIAIRPGTEIESVPFAYSESRIRPGASVFSIGCDRGGLPGIVESRITTVDRYMGPSNIQVAGQPIVGRSGGGLFSSDGTLIGVCNAADPTDNEGLYAALSTIQAELDDNQLSFIYQPNTQPLETPSPDPLLANDRFNSPARSMNHEVSGIPSMPREMPSAPLAVDVGAATPQVMPTQFEGLMDPTNDLEVICIVQSRSNVNGRSEVIRLQQPSAAFVDQLAREYQSQLGHHPTDMRIEQAGITSNRAKRAWEILW